MKLRDTFNGVIGDYNYARPHYPDGLYHDIWIPAEVGYKKAYELLKPGGTMAVFWHMSSVTLHVGPVHDGLNGLKRQYMPEVSLGFDEEGLRAAHEKRLAQIQTGGWFPAPEYHEYRWDDRYDAVRYAALLNSYSDTQEYLSEEKRAEYLKAVAGHIERCGGEVEMPQYVRLYLVKK